MLEVSLNGIKQIRLGQNKNDVVRIVAEAEASMPIHVKADVSPIEIWFGMPPKAQEGVPVAAARLPAKPTPIPKREENAPLGLAMRKIVIDPGHGGHDPGAIGVNGLQEKDVTLSISLKLKAALEEQMPGVHVYLTRDTDKYVALGERTEFANNLDADLFISVHVNSSPNRKTQGIETYYLDITHDRYAVRLASRENAMSESEISNLEFILADLAMKSNVSDSVRLGREVQASTYGHLQSSWSDVKDLGLKHALFYVLLGARMPAVLVETSFISNRDDEKRLRTDRYLKEIVAGLVKGVLRYSEQKQAMYQP
jgi:N-acetylmuramoyl-L-alanine amidase